MKKTIVLLFLFNITCNSLFASEYYDKALVCLERQIDTLSKYINVFDYVVNESTAHADLAIMGNRLVAINNIYISAGMMVYGEMEYDSKSKYSPGKLSSPSAISYAYMEKARDFLNFTSQFIGLNHDVLYNKIDLALSVAFEADLDLRQTEASSIILAQKKIMTKYYKVKFFAKKYGVFMEDFPYCSGTIKKLGKEK